MLVVRVPWLIRTQILIQLGLRAYYFHGGSPAELLAL